MTITLLILLSLVSAQRPDFDYGRPGEMSGLTRVYVHTDLDLKSREAIIKDIEKNLPSVTIAERREDADIVLFYGQDVTRDFRGTVGNTTVGDNSAQTTKTPVYGRTVSGSGFVVRPGEPGKRDRVLMQFEDEKRGAFERKPAVNFARAFIKAWKEANQTTK